MSDRLHQNLRETIERYRREANVVRDGQAAQMFVGLAEELEFNLRAIESPSRRDRNSPAHQEAVVMSDVCGGVG